MGKGMKEKEKEEREGRERGEGRTWQRKAEGEEREKGKERAERDQWKGGGWSQTRKTCPNGRIFRVFCVVGGGSGFQHEKCAQTGAVFVFFLF